MGWIKAALQNWLNIAPAVEPPINIFNPFSYAVDVFRNRMWYRGDASELHQFYTQIDDNMWNTSFWSARPSTRVKLRKIHSGLPSLIVDKLVDIVVDSLLGVELDTDTDTAKWEGISEAIMFENLLREALRSVLVDGDGAFKISHNPDVSEYPIVEFKSGSDLGYEYDAGFLRSVRFKTKIKQGAKAYLFVETYTESGITYALYDEQEKEVPLSTIPEYADLEDFAAPIMLAEQLMLSRSAKYAGRGKSLFASKSGAFDAFDETISQWIDALRDGRTRTYFPKNLVPIDSNGQPLEPNPFDNRWYAMGADLQEDAKNQVEVVQGNIQSDPLIQAYGTYLDLALQGILSPSTLGIDVKKLDNAESQREKEKTTLYTRNKIINILNNTVPPLVNKIIRAYDFGHGVQAPKEYVVTIKFGEYANPSFEAQVETIAKARVGGIMSIEQCVEEMYGDTWSNTQKAAEVVRLKGEQGVVEAVPMTEQELLQAAKVR